MDRMFQGNLSESQFDNQEESQAEPLITMAQSELNKNLSQAIPEEVQNSVQPKRPRFWAVGGGKGGVGKSLISANFALMLARRGLKVLAVDLDLGGSNLHTCLGVEPPKVGIGDYLFGRSADIESLSVPTSDAHLRIISGCRDPLQVANVGDDKRKHLMSLLRGVDADEIIIDLGAGTQDFTVDFFNEADEGILSVLPEPTSVENAYRFVRSAFYKRLMKAEGISSGIREVIEAATDPKNVLGIRTPADLLAVIERLDVSASEILRERIRSFQPSIVMNQVRSQVDVDVGRAICSVCRRYFGIDVKYPGYIDYDNYVWKAVRAKKAVVDEFPRSSLAMRIEKLTSSLLGEEKGLFP